MMTTHRIVLKTHPLLTTHVRSVHSILFRSGLQTTKRPEGRHFGKQERLRPLQRSGSAAVGEQLQTGDGV